LSARPRGRSRRSSAAKEVAFVRRGLVTASAMLRVSLLVRLTLALASLVAVGARTGVAEAQVNTEPLRKRVKAAGYSGVLEGSVTGRTGNTEGIQAGVGAGFGLSHEPHLFFVYGTADYSRFNGATQVAKNFAHARYTCVFLPGLWGELFAQASSDEFQRMKLRNLFGVGPRFRVAHDDAYDAYAAYVGTAYMLERDVINVEPGSNDDRTLVYSRWSTYVTGRWDVDPRMQLSLTAYFQPRFTEFSNVRLLGESLFAFKVTGFLSATLSCVVRYDSDPPSGVKTADTELKNALSFSF
jgi:hypothetical protein